MSLPREILLVYLISPLVPFSWCIGISKSIRNRFGRGNSSVQVNIALRMFYLWTTVISLFRFQCRLVSLYDGTSAILTHNFAIKRI
jgi:hypothetical protein